jgi:hypothetical protein
MTTTTHAHTSDNRTFDPASEAALAQLVDAYRATPPSPCSTSLTTAPSLSPTSTATR